MMDAREKSISKNRQQPHDLIYIAAEAYSVFNAGPTKTADIEEGLVIDEHGSFDFSLVIINE